MTIVEQIDAAIRAHNMWKERLSMAIDQGVANVDPFDVAKDNLCPFGQWLYGKTTEAEKKTEEYTKVLALHAVFHKEASKVMEFALQHNKYAAFESMNEESDYYRVSNEMTETLLKWKAKILARTKASR
jgi:hypothetical protein